MNRTNTQPVLRVIRPEDLERFRRAEAVTPAMLDRAGAIVEAVRRGDEHTLRSFASEHDGLHANTPIVAKPAELERALGSIDSGTRDVLERAADQIRTFAEAQREALHDIDVPVPGGRAGHTVIPVAHAGCYAPGGRYPLPSSVLMTVVTARAAGVGHVIAATPSNDPIMLAAASIAGADGVLRCGGAHAVAAMAFGVEGVIDAVDAIAGPGNAWVTAAKKIVSGQVAIDMLAGPSELLVLADETADAALVAADLLAQAEHDDEALPILVATDLALIDAVNTELVAQLETLPTRHTARRALANGFACLCETLDDAIGVADRVASEHLEIQTRDPASVASRLTNAGALFVGPRSAEVFGDYGLGPNHTLPTGGTARYVGGLSVMSFLRVRTWMQLEGEGPVDQATVSNAAALARLEGLEAHARAAERRA